MRFKLRNGRLWALALGAFLGLTLPTVGQTTVYWDINGSTTGASGGTTAAGTWDQSTTSNWTTSSTGTTTPDDWATRVTSSTCGNARFSAGTNATGTYTVTVSGDVGNNSGGYIYAIYFDEGTITLGGAGTLYTRAGGIINNTSNLQTIGANVFLSLNQTWNSGNGGLLINGGVTMAANRTLTVTGTGGVTVSGVFSDSGTRRLTKNGTGTLTLTGANTYTGGTTINAGILSTNSIANGGASSGIGNSTNAANRLIINGGTLRYTGGATTTNRRFTIGTNGATIDGSGTGTLKFTDASAITLTGTNTARTLTLTGTNTSYYNDGNTIAGVLADNGTGATSLVKDGTGTWQLSGSNTYTGTTTINAGTLQLGSNNTLSDSTNVIINSGGTLQLNSITDTVGSLTGDGTLFLQGGTFTTNTAANTTFSGTISDTYGNFRKAGTGDLTLSGNNTFGGITYIDGGTLIAASSTALGGSTSGNQIANGATLGLQGNISLTEGSFSLQGTGDGGVGAINNISGNNTLNTTLNLAGATTIGSSTGSLTLGGMSLGYALTTTGSGNLQFTGDIYGSGSLTKNGTGTLTFSGTGNNSFSGGVSLNDGTIVLAKSAGISAIGQGTVNIGDGSGAPASATLQLNASNQIHDDNNIVIASDGRLNL
ncbi:MAG: autotransporter-associated beta strand repeat-containing protein, partial [Cephaloticoccus sp.]|nr:autotransporter-associated beta strand repeat-containing protein [Cephaloticoccus sp.]